MGIDVYLEDETGEKLESIYDPTSILPRLLPSHADKSSQCLRFIDPYGVTVFNGLQMPFLLEELETLLQRTQGQEAKSSSRALLNWHNELRMTCISISSLMEIRTYLKLV